MNKVFKIILFYDIILLNSVGDKMSSRMDRYFENEKPVGSRTARNERLYEEISHDDLNDVNISSNAHVIGDNDLGIEKIKELLQKKYPEEPKKTSIFMQPEEKKVELLDTEETKEYDINAILEKAKSKKDVHYERDRLKKIHDTQYDILKNLNLENNKQEPESKVTSNKADLMNLINTITEKELTRELNPLDILTDLKGSDDTVVLDGIEKEVQHELKETVKEEVKKEMDKSFFTNSLSFTQSDFDDFNDLKEDMESNKLIVRVLLIIVAIALVVGMVFLVNSIFHFNWF